MGQFLDPFLDFIYVGHDPVPVELQPTDDPLTNSFSTDPSVPHSVTEGTVPVLTQIHRYPPNSVQHSRKLDIVPFIFV